MFINCILCTKDVSFIVFKNNTETFPFIAEVQIAAVVWNSFVLEKHVAHWYGNEHTLCFSKCRGGSFQFSVFSTATLKWASALCSACVHLAKILAVFPSLLEVDFEILLYLTSLHVKLDRIILLPLSCEVATCSLFLDYYYTITYFFYGKKQ